MDIEEHNFPGSSSDNVPSKAACLIFNDISFINLSWLDCSESSLLALGAGSLLALGAGSVLALGAGSVLALGAGSLLALGVGSLLALGASSDFGFDDSVLLALAGVPV